MKDKVIELREGRDLMTRFLLIQQKQPEIMNSEEAIGEYEFSAVPRSLIICVRSQGGTSISGGRGAWPKNLLLKFLLEPQILPPKI